jgi:sulfide dehydrogenase cytochrome subunit
MVMLRIGLVVALGVLCVGAPQMASAQAPLAVEGCVGCHGPNAGGSGSVAGIAGRDAREISTALLAFRAGERTGAIMGRIARGYTDDEIAAIAAYLAGLRR